MYQPFKEFFAGEKAKLITNKKQELPQIIQQLIDEGLIKINGLGEVWSASTAKTPVYLGHISKITKLENYLKKYPNEYEWKQLSGI